MPSGIPRRLATSARPSPSSSHSTSGVRNDSGSRASSASSTGAQSGEVGATSAAASESGIGTSRDRRLASRPRARIAHRVATPCSHGPRRFGSRKPPAFLASTNSVACATSSASGAFDSTRRQTAPTIGPCRRASSANAPSSRAAAKRRSSSASVALRRSAVVVIGVPCVGGQDCPDGGRGVPESWRPAEETSPPVPLSQEERGRSVLGGRFSGASQDTPSVDAWNQAHPLSFWERGTGVRSLRLPPPPQPRRAVALHDVQAPARHREALGHLRRHVVHLVGELVLGEGRDGVRLAAAAEEL